MKDLFPGFYQHGGKDFGELWEKCLFIVDTNVLLNLYRYLEEAKADLLKVLQRISDRLWLPYQAALEYQTNHLIVIAEQNKKFSNVKEVIDESEGKPINGLERLHLGKSTPPSIPEAFFTKQKNCLLPLDES